MDYKHIIESRYNRDNWLQLLHDIFGNKAEFWRATSMNKDVDHTVAKWVVPLGQIKLSDGNTIAVYEVELADSVQIERNRAAIRNLLYSQWHNIHAGAFMFCQRREEAYLRFSYVSEAWTFKEDGSYVKESTEPRRFTYLLGEGHRSRTAIRQFEELKKSDLSLKALTKAFSVEAISDMFFDGYKRHYENIVCYITGKRMVKEGGKWIEKQEGAPCEEIMSEFQHFADPEKSVRDYVKRLMGRLVFLQFLQKKGWLGVPAGEGWKGGDKEFLQNLFIRSPYKDTFVDDVLEPLFNDINTRRGEDLVTDARVGTGIKIPYLNGGLFERSAEDDTTFPLPAKYLHSLIVDFFASYNFTIDENDPNDAEVGVDAEMLGRIFENLLEDNKDKGAFYTPKEIVQYMCRESLIAYLTTETAMKEEYVREFVTEHKLSDNIQMSDRPKLLKALREVKICDPAIGSGAFPMGLLNELVACRSAIGDDARLGRAALKREIIQNNIYGVDIERGAVDIARLRFWLSLIVDEENPEALPNMDFKIVQGNSLITTFNGQYLNLEKNGKLNSRNQFIENEKNRLNDLQHQYFSAVGEHKLLLGIEVKSCILNIIAAHYGHELRVLADTAYNENEIFENTKAVSVREIASRVTLSKELKEALDLGASLRKQLNDETKPLAERAKLELNFFDWHIMFADVFGTKGGFDIVIGNPPYVDSETMTKTMPSLRELYSKVYNCAQGNWDLFIVFIEKGINLLKEGGIFSNIIPNKLIAAKYAVSLRQLIASRSLIEIRDYSRIDVFENAAVYPITITLRNSKIETDSIFSVMSTKNEVKQSNLTSSLSLQDLDYWDVFFSDTTVFCIMKKINSCKPLKEYSVEVLGAATVADAYEIKKIVLENNGMTGFKLVNSGTIDPYMPLWGIKACRYIKGSYVEPVVSGEELLNYSNVRYSQSCSPKIIVASMTTRYEAMFDIDGEFIAGKSTTILLGDPNILKSLTAIINSKLASFWLNVQFNSLKMSGGAINVGRNELLLLPVADKSDMFEPLVDDILTAKKANPYSDIADKERIIDNLVYVLYDLTYNEVKVIEPDFPMSEEEYNDFKQAHQNM